MEQATGKVMSAREAIEKFVHDGDEVVIVPSLKDEDEINKRFPKGYRAVKPYLRLTPQPNK